MILGIFRPIRWYRNVFMLLGSFLALELNGLTVGREWISIAVSLLALCLIASANYGVNEVFDAESDGHHPKKKFRAIPSGLVSKGLVLSLSIALYVVGLAVALTLRNEALLLSLVLMIASGILYNVPPFRFKDVAYLDFMFEAIDNPIRLLIGWYAVTSVVVPVSLVLSFYAVGLFLMAAKRFGELRFLQNTGEAALYRRSLQFYSEKKLLLIMIGAASVCMYLFGVLTVRHQINLVFAMPFVVIFVVWFFNLAYEDDSIVKDPERLFENKAFLLFVVLLAALMLWLWQYQPALIRF